MYKVFFNGSCIVLYNGNENSLKDNKVQVVDSESDVRFISVFEKIEKKRVDEKLFFLCDNLEKEWEKFRAQFIQITAAGGIVFNRDGQFLAIKRWKKWDLPKGKVEKGESIEAAALREVSEECSISGMYIRKTLGSVFHVYRSPFYSEPNNWVLKETCWFSMCYDGTEVPKPQTSESIDEVRWFEQEEIGDFYANTYPNLIDLMNRLDL